MRRNEAPLDITGKPETFERSLSGNVKKHVLAPPERQGTCHGGEFHAGNVLGAFDEFSGDAIRVTLVSNRTPTGCTTASRTAKPWESRTLPRKTRSASFRLFRFTSVAEIGAPEEGSTLFTNPGSYPSLAINNWNQRSGLRPLNVNMPRLSVMVRLPQSA